MKTPALWSRSRVDLARAHARPLERWQGNRAFSWMVNQALKLYCETMDTSSGHPRLRRDPAQLNTEDAITATTAQQPGLAARVRETAIDLDEANDDFSSLAEHLGYVADRLECEETQ